MKAFHVWLLDGRSLCDRFDKEDADVVPAKNPDGIRPCGACVLAAEQLFFEVKELIFDYGQPALTPPAALDLLRDTRWGEQYDIKTWALSLEGVGYRYPWYEGFARDQELDHGRRRANDGSAKTNQKEKTNADA